MPIDGQRPKRPVGMALQVLRRKPACKKMTGCYRYPMKVVVQNKKTGCYLGPGNAWVSKVEQAVNLKTTYRGIIKLHQQNLPQGRVILRFKDPRYNVTIDGLELSAPRLLVR